MANYSGVAGAFRKLTDMTTKTRPLNSARGSHACALWTHVISYFNTLILTHLRLSNLLSEGIRMNLASLMNYLKPFKVQECKSLAVETIYISMHDFIRFEQKHCKEIGSNGNRAIKRPAGL